METGKVINGTGVRLRPYLPSDIDGLVSGYADPATRRFMPPVPVPFTRQDAEWYVREAAPSVFAEGGAMYAIADPATGRLLGGVGRGNGVPNRGQQEIGYWVGPWARRRGVATAAVRALAADAFESGLARLELLTHWENGASQRVALGAGFRREGERRGALPNRRGGRDDLIAYARLSDDPDGPVPRALPDLPDGGLTDGVVTLRPLGPADLKFYSVLHGQPDVIATTVPPEPFSADEMRERCERAEAKWLAGDAVDLVITDTASGAPAGEISLYYHEPPTGTAMIGYSMLPGWRGRGFPTRATQLLSLWTFAETGVARLIAGALPTNRGSQRVLQKAGFKQEAYLRSRLPGANGTRNDDVQFVLLAEDVARDGPRLDG